MYSNSYAEIRTHQKNVLSGRISSKSTGGPPFLVVKSSRPAGESRGTSLSNEAALISTTDCPGGFLIPYSLPLIVSYLRVQKGDRPASLRYAVIVHVREVFAHHKFYSKFNSQAVQ